MPVLLRRDAGLRAAGQRSFTRAPGAMYLLTSSKTRSRSNLVGMINGFVGVVKPFCARLVCDNLTCTYPPCQKKLCMALISLGYHNSLVYVCNHLWLRMCVPCGHRWPTLVETTSWFY